MITLNILIQITYITYQIKYQDVYFHPVKFYEIWTRFGYRKTHQKKSIAGERIWQECLTIEIIIHHHKSTSNLIFIII